MGPPASWDCIHEEAAGKLANIRREIGVLNLGSQKLAILAELRLSLFLVSGGREGAYCSFRFTLLGALS